MMPQLKMIYQSIEMLLQAKHKYPNIKVRLGNFLDEPFEENKFDVVVSTYAFHHLTPDEKRNAVSIMMEYLKPGGKIVIADLMFLNEKEKAEEKKILFKSNKEDLWNIIENEYYTNIEKIKDYLENFGCKVKYKHIVNFTWLVEIIKRR